MYINDRDQINYHGFLKSLREMQGANLKQVAEGICSDSEVYRTEIGDRLPEKLMRDRITSRLGVSGEEYEEYLRPEEYRQWEIRMFILDHINKGNPDEVRKGIEEYEKILDKNPVMEQFVDTMRYMLAQMNNAPVGMLQARIELALAHTVPDVTAAFAGAQLLADQELNLIAEYTRLRDYYGRDDEFEWRLGEYLNILEYIDNSYIDTIGRSKVYPRVTCYICELILNQNPKKKNLELALDLCIKSIELLRDASRLYYFVELLEYRKKIITGLLEYKLSDSRRAELQWMYDKDLEWENLLRELYTEYDVPIYMQNFTYLYVETECNSAVEVIRTRRNMVKLSRLKVSDNICTEKTVERFENYTHSPSIAIIRDIFERIGLCAEYKRARVITDNAEMLKIVNKLTDYINSWNTQQSKYYLEQLEANLHMDIPYNMQTIQRLKNIISVQCKEDSEENLYKRALSALECTIPFGAVIRKAEIYLTRVEWFCVYDLAFKVSGEVSYTCYKLIEKLWHQFKDGKVEESRLCIYEILMSELASYLGDNAKYEESSCISEKLMKESLAHRRLVVLADNLYNKIWNYEKLIHMNHGVCDSNKVKIELSRCLLLSEIDKKDNWVSFLHNKIRELN